MISMRSWQRTRDPLERVRRRDEHDLREIVVDVEVVVVERAFCSGSSTSRSADDGIAAEIGRHLVDLVEAGRPDSRSRLLHRLDDLAGQRTDVGPTVAADLSLVPDAAERNANELPARRTRDRLAERRLADAGRADQAQDRGPLSCPTRLWTARYSRMRCFTFSRP
jgi:hypothetical protein